MALPEYPQILLDLKAENDERDDSALEQIANVAEQIRGLWNYAGAETFEKYAPNLEQIREEAAGTDDFYDVWSSELADEDPYGAFIVELEQVLADDDYGYREMELAVEFMRETVSDMLWKQADVYLDGVNFDEMHEKLQRAHEREK